MNREKNLMMYGFVSVLLLASFLMTVPANQYQKIFAQTEGETPQDNGVNVTEAIQENATDTEIPPFENQNATFVPPPESEREAPPVPSNATKGADLPDEMPPKDPDSQPLSVSNRTELLEVLPANSTKIIEHVNEDLKNSTGEGLLPPAILDKIISGEGQGNDTILDISTPEELDEIRNFSESTTNQTAEEALDEGEPISNLTNATGLGGLLDEGMINATNATATETPGEEQEEAEDEGEDQAQAGEAVNMTNATGGEFNMTNATGGEEQEQQEQDEDAEGGEEEQGQAGAEQQQEEAEGGEEQEQAGDEEQEDAEDGEEQEQAVTNATNATVPQPPEGMLNTTNVTSMLNATSLEDETEDSEDSPEEEPDDE